MEYIPINNNISIIKKSNIKKQRCKGIIFARLCCTLGILLFHYFCHSKCRHKLLFNTANSQFGFIYVTSFFCISGTVLYYNYPKVVSVKLFYYKRWKSIFPSFYIIFIYYYIRNVFTYKKLFFREHWSKLFFSLIGMDSYLSYRIKTYFIVGEWFLGAIIIIYLLYPSLSWLMNKNILFIKCRLYFNV